jgi:branched-chain amino acid transport system permease protein
MVVPSPSVLGQYIINGLAIGSQYVLIAMGLNLVFGILDIADFAQGNLYLLAAYLLFMFTGTYNLPFFGGAVLAVIVTGLVGLAYYYVVYRQLLDEPPITMFLAAFGLFATIQGFVFFIWGPDFRDIAVPFSGSFQVGNMFINKMRLYGIAITAVVIVFAFLFINRTRYGRAIRAVAQNKTKSSLLGIDNDHMYALTFLVASLLAAIAGVSVAPIFTVTPFIGLDAILKGFIVAIFGGLGSVRGAVVAGFLLGIIESLATIPFSGELANSIGFLILFGVLIFRPQGLFGRVEATA